MRKPRLVFSRRLALTFLVACLLSLARCESPDRNRLHRFYELTNGPLWKNHTHWNTTKPICSWFGIECANGSKDDDTGVTAITLPSNGLAGRVAKILYEIPTLLTLNLKDNSLTDAGFEGLSKETSTISNIILTENGITSMEGIGNAPSTLTELHLTKNRLRGTFPVELTRVTSLKRLFLSQNQLKGSLPTEIGNMSDLGQVFLYGNMLSGSLPTEIGFLQKTEIFTLAQNNFTGSIPSSIETMGNLHTLSLHDNDLTGTLPLLRNVPYIKEIYLDHNQLVGTIPHKFIENALATNLGVVHIGLSYNQLTGTIPIDLDRFSFLELQVVANEISHIPSELCKIHSWMSGLVEQYGCDAILCPSGTYNSDGRQTSDETPCVPCGDATGYLGSTTCDDPHTVSEVEILTEFYSSLRGNKWVKESGWTQLDDSDDVDVCLFHGITCNDDKTVQEMNLSNNGLIGTVPTLLFQLPALTKLDISRNAVTLTSEGIQAMGRRGTVSRLNIASTHSIDLTGIGLVKSLRVLDISGMRFGTPLPPALFELLHVEEIHARFSNFMGTLPTLIGNLVNLTRLELNHNEFTGLLPTELGQLTRIRRLDLAENKFVGGIPAELNKLTSLHKLYLHQVSGTLNGKLPAFDVFTDLVELSLDSNSFSGTIPSTFMSGVSDKDQPIVIDLSNNLLDGTVPVELEDFSNLTIHLEGNQISDIPEDLCDMDDWMNGEVGQVGSCDAILCPTGTWNLYGRASSRLDASCLPCATSTVYGSTTCGADLDPFPEKTILDNLFRQTGGRYWNSSTSWTDSTLGICFREGIACDSLSDGNSGVTEIRLPNNGLSGIIPPSIFKLPKLRVMDFSHNDVDLDLSDIGQAIKLEIVQMTNTKVESLRGIGRAPPSLTELNFAQNQMAGEIPSELFTLSNLRALLLDKNLLTGSIPTSIGGLSRIVSLDFSHNDLTGHLPTELGLLDDLTLLNLRENQLSGVIPSSLGMLKHLSMISLASQWSDNKLSGPLYPFDTNPVLTAVDLSDNAISGTIPANFLSAVGDTQAISVKLSNNEITGTVPVSLDSFQSFFIDLSANKIESLPGVLCDEDNAAWMDGKVGEFKSCNAILCRPGTAAEHGRQVDSDSSCQPCPGGEVDAPYYGATACSSSRVASDRNVLVSLYESLNGTHWVQQDNWMSDDASICTWHGVTCDTDDTVVALELKSNNLHGTMDVSSLFFALPKLVTLDIRGNSVPLDLTKIPVESEIVSLKLSSTGLSSLDGIGNARKLRTLLLSGNVITGKIPAEFFTLNELEAVYLSFNTLTGTLSTRIGKMTNLVNFYVDGNDLVGRIPSELGLLSDLNNLVLSDNLFAGTIPVELGSLPNLRRFSAHRRTKPGPRLNGTLPAFENAPLLKELFLEHNDLQGAIPSNFLNASTSASLVILSHNRLTGTVPVGLDSIPAVNLQLEGNLISKYPDEFCNNIDWMDGALGRVGCDAFLCPPGTANAVGRATDTLSCDECSSSNEAIYYGSTTCEDVPSERQSLLLLYQKCGGIEWKQKSGWTTDADICQWDGISCHPDGSVKSIDLSANNLVSSPPPEIFQLPRLESLILSSNPISFSFKGIEKARRLTELRLEATGLSSVEYIKGGPGLIDLNLRFNDLQGTFPEEIFALWNLRSLNLANNKLESSLPFKFSAFKKLQTLRLGYNDFTGAPPHFSHTISLKTLDLSHNSFSGKVPFNLLQRVNPTATIFVNLASNKFTGDLPVELDRFNDMTLYLRDNQIDDIPSIFCHKSGWNDGDVEDFGCDGILCPPGTYNQLGRQSSDDTPCIQCPADGEAPYYGQTTCLSSSASTSHSNVWLIGSSVAIVAIAALRS